MAVTVIEPRHRQVLCSSDLPSNNVGVLSSIPPTTKGGTTAIIAVIPLTAGSHRLSATTCHMSVVAAIVALDTAPVLGLRTIPGNMAWLVTVTTAHNPGLVAFLGYVARNPTIEASTSGTATGVSLDFRALILVVANDY